MCNALISPLDAPMPSITNNAMQSMLSMESGTYYAAVGTPGRRPGDRITNRMMMRKMKNVIEMIKCSSNAKVSRAIQLHYEYVY